MGEPKSITIHEARQHADGLLYLRIGGRWYRLKTSEPPRGETTAVHLVLGPGEGVPAPDELLPPVLMSEQEIRVRALELAVRWFINSTGDPGDTLDVARRFEAYIRGGSDA
jgi:hypothetical protein